MSLQILLAEESKGERDRRMSLGKYTLIQVVTQRRMSLGKYTLIQVVTQRRMSLGKYTLIQVVTKNFLVKTSYFPKLCLNSIIHYQRHLKKNLAF